MEWLIKTVFGEGEVLINNKAFRSRGEYLDLINCKGLNAIEQIAKTKPLTKERRQNTSKEHLTAHSY